MRAAIPFTLLLLACGGPTGPGDPLSPPSCAVPSERGSAADLSRLDPNARQPMAPIDAEPTCALGLRFTDADGEPVAGEVELWQLAAPAEGSWSAGDRLVDTTEHEGEGARFESLAPGRYRARHLGAHPSGADPPPFEVAGSLTELSFAARVPRSFAATLQLFDEHGQALETVQGRLRTGHTWSRPRPSWAIERTSGDGTASTSVAGGGGSFGGRAFHRRLDAEASGFELGTFRGNTAGRHYAHRAALLLRGRSDVECAFDGSREEALAFRAMSVPLAPLEDAVRLPDGRRATEAGATLEATGAAVRAEDPTPIAELPIEVRVVLGGYEPLEFTYRAADGQVPERILVPERAD